MTFTPCLRFKYPSLYYILQFTLFRWSLSVSTCNCRDHNIGSGSMVLYLSLSAPPDKNNITRHWRYVVCCLFMSMIIKLADWPPNYHKTAKAFPKSSQPPFSMGVLDSVAFLPPRVRKLSRKAKNHEAKKTDYIWWHHNDIKMKCVTDCDDIETLQNKGVSGPLKKLTLNEPAKTKRFLGLPGIQSIR